VRLADLHAMHACPHRVDRQPCRRCERQRRWRRWSASRSCGRASPPSPSW
jgi:hypothetical protein